MKSLKWARRSAVVASLVAISIVLSGCSSWFLPPAAATSKPTDEKVSAALVPYYHQVLSWTACANGFECTKAIVPLDWSNPGGARIKLAMVRHQADDGHPLGSLLVDPGGPGASGVALVEDSLSFAVDSKLQNSYDIVGFDPRGVNGSSAVHCYSNPKTLDNFYFGITKGAIGSSQWITEQEAEQKQFGEDCAKYTGPLLAHVDTVSAARDMDVLRAALGDKKLNYLGYSYGTLLGQTYANLFPKKTGRLVLDGVVDPTASSFAGSEDQAVGFEGDLRAFVKKCPQYKGCPFTGSVDSSMASISGLLAKLGTSPLRNKDGRELGSDTMATAIIEPLYSTKTWSDLVDVFASVAQGDPSVAFESADAYFDRNEDGTYQDNLIEAFTAVDCLDYTSDPSVATMRAQAAELTKAAPVFGPYMAYGGTACYDWPYKPVGLLKSLSAAGSAPILVVGTTGDPATPYREAVHVASLLQNGHLITYHGNGHTAYNKNSTPADECVNSAVDDFFLHGTVPKTDPQCGAR
jgi:pimeloyl-ACP methyl ester carboxylesterase